MQITERFRPRDFAGIVGNPGVTRFLSRFVEAPQPGALLLEGPSGIGKTTCARILADRLARNELDRLELDGPNVGVAEARDLDGFARAVPWATDGFRVVIVDEADQMSRAAQVALLGTLERLVSAVVVFTSNEAGDFEPRFLSRCRVLHFTTQGIANPAAAHLVAVAKELGFDLPPKYALRLVQEAKNNVRAAMQAVEIESLSL